MTTKSEKIKVLLEEIEKLMKELNIPDQILEREIKHFGNTCHITIPLKYLNKKAIIIIKK